MGGWASSLMKASPSAPWSQAPSRAPSLDSDAADDQAKLRRIGMEVIFEAGDHQASGTAQPSCRSYGAWIIFGGRSFYKHAAPNGALKAARGLLSISHAVTSLSRSRISPSSFFMSFSITSSGRGGS